MLLSPGSHVGIYQITASLGAGGTMRRAHMRYTAFISYSHAADGRLAPALQHALHRLAKPWYRMRQLRVFRDQTSLSADPRLWSSIVNALQQSEWFLLMASSDAAKSPWVRKELEWWLQHRDPMRILIVLTGDDVVWDATRQDFDWARTRAIPRELSGRFSEEPLYVDLRWAHEQENLTLRHTQFRAAVLDLAAPLHGKSKDELDGEDVRQYRRTRRILYSVTGLIAVLAAVATWQASVAVQQRVEAEAQRDEARRQRDLAEERRQIALSRQLAAQSIASERLDQALLLTVTALRIRSTQEARDNFVRVLRSFGRRPQFLETPVLGVRDMRFSPDGTVLATGGDTAALWDMTTRPPRRRALQGADRLVEALSFSPDGAVLAGAAGDAVRLWATATGASIGHPLTNPLLERVFGVAFGRDGTTVSAEGFSSVTTWETATGTQVRTRPRPVPTVRRLVPHPSAGPVFSADGRTVAFGTDDGVVRLWETATLRRLGPSMEAQGGPVRALAFTGDGQRLAASYQDKTVVLWNLHTYTSVGETLRGAPFRVTQLAFAPGGDMLAGASTSVTLWDLTTPGFVTSPFVAHPQSVVALAYGRASNLLASAGAEGTVRLWDGEAQRIGPALQHKGVARAVTFSGDGQWLASAGQDGVVVLRSAVTGEAIGVPMKHGGDVWALGFSPDSRLLGSGGGQTVALWSVATQSRVTTASVTDLITAVAFTPDSHMLAVADNTGRVHLFNGVNGAPNTPRLEGAGSTVWSIAFDRNGRFLAGGTEDGSVVLWDIERREQKPLVLGTHRRAVPSIAFAPDGRVLASVGRDGTVAFWDSVAKKPLLEPTKAYQGELTSIAYRRDGKMLALGSRDGRVAQWSADVADPRTLGCAIANRNLSQIEWWELAGLDVPYESAC